ncbi:hypothetical protein M433DRAFT_155874 [Acidomyces richmondensis BFW]|nr:MAG: hypothetical protein FE78DRAFT_92588 [Acidomyces sp. 'richmondensis']KYG44189.1 hypothetical protein M433DRAFT_155874 [Acidomyces richmondensis BFW]
MFVDAVLTAGTGVAFGAALTASRVHLPSVIVNQMALKDFRMMQVFSVAMGSSAAIMLLLEKSGILKRPLRANAPLGWFSQYDGNIVGGMMVGLGMTLSGACPGTVLVQLAQGIPSARAAFVGCLLGGMTYVRFHKSFKRPPPDGCQPCKEHISERTKIPEIALYTTLGLMVAGVVTFFDIEGKSAVLSPVVGGLLIGAVQAASLLLLGSPLGVSTVYEHIGQYICAATGYGKCGSPAWPPKTILTALGIITGSIALTNYVDLPAPGKAIQIPFVQALIGGWVMAFGARTAGGCTSGHGLSGLSAMSFSSLITVGSMFAAGILSQQILMRL